MRLDKLPANREPYETTSERKENKNFEFLDKLLRSLDNIPDCPALDEYGTKIFETPIKGSWNLFRDVVRKAVEGYWMWNSDQKVASFPKVAVPSYEVFVTYMLHEATHGWCFFLKKDKGQFRYPTGIDEEQVCWDISKLICGVLGITYAENEANESHAFHLAVQRGDIDEVGRLFDNMPPHRKQKGE